MNLEQEIKQNNFDNEQQKAHINILYTASWVSLRSAKMLKPLNISIQQFNILRILRGLHPKPATVKLLTERMIDKTSNASRLVEKLKQKGLVEREASIGDRRCVEVRITPMGLKVLEQASQLMRKSIEQTFAGFSDKEAVELNHLLDKLRG